MNKYDGPIFLQNVIPADGWFNVYRIPTWRSYDYLIGIGKDHRLSGPVAIGELIYRIKVTLKHKPQNDQSFPMQSLQTLTDD